mmetsp:Transcript_24540/g.28596  ORF Transcript_24540/g.28596 Transcript_24540/m.28596 type:complete len:81 (+) Transcript_24540:237-479(+)
MCYEDLWLISEKQVSGEDFFTKFYQVLSGDCLNGILTINKLLASTDPLFLGFFEEETTKNRYSSTTSETPYFLSPDDWQN